MRDLDREQRKRQIALDVLTLSRNTLLVNLRFLDVALNQFKYIPVEQGTILTDGCHIFFNPEYILTTYQVEKEIPTRDYLHIVFHCVFRHMYGVRSLNRSLWDLACDIFVEYIIAELGIKSATAQREKEEKPIINELEDELGILSAEKIYGHYIEKELPDEEIEKLKAVFRGDEHDIWYMSFLQIKQTFIEEDKEGGKSPQDDKSTLANKPNNDPQGENNQTIKEEYDEQRYENQSKIWKEISERIQLDLETYSKSIGDTASKLIQNLSVINREKYDYASFLKKFAVRGEALMINDEEFDYIFYTYGLKLYENMPLVEPLEYKDVKRIKEFVIAIDTSGSVMGEEVQAFMQKTYNILKSTETFFSRINIHIIQCDAEIQEHVKISSQEEFDSWIDNMEIKGFGGTDFRPVFSKVDELINNHEFFNLKGLIYFTDGYGEFPRVKPNYETAFVFIDSFLQEPEVPSWAIKIILRKDELFDAIE